MLLAIDIGNTNITLGAFSGDALIFTARLATDKGKTADQYAVEIKNIISLNNCDYKSIDNSIISSVVPVTTAAVRAAVEKLFKNSPFILGPGSKTGLDIRIDNPAQLGADLAAGAVGAIARFAMPCIVIDLGTASTISVLGKNGELLGGAIAAGVGLTLEALTRRTAQLPSIDISAPRSVIGTNTVDSMKSGLVMGAASMIDGMIDRIEDELGVQATVVATGGLAYEIVHQCRHAIELCDTLLLEGLKIIFDKNNKK